MTGRSGVIVVVCLCSWACKKERANEQPRPNPEPPVVESLFIIARPEVTRGPLPARFTAPLPASLRELAAGAHPPMPFIRVAARADTFQMRRRFLDAIARASAAGPIPEELASWYSGAFAFAPDPATCKWLVEAATTGKTEAPVRAVLWRTAGRCRDAAMAELMARDDVPDAVIVDWYSDHTGEVAYRERVARAAMNVARASRDDSQVRKVGFVFARMRGEESVAAIVALRKSIGDPQRRALVGLGMLRSASAKGRAIGEGACRQPEVANDAMCTRDDPALERRPRTDLSGMIDDGEEVATLVATFPRADVLAALTECVNSGREYRSATCFEQIAQIDRTAAVALAGGLVASEDADLARAARSLIEFAEAGSLENELVRLGFKLDRKAREPQDRAILTVEDVLIARGRIEWFDVETGMFPNEHDELLAELAALAAPVLDDVVFEEIPPSEADMDRGSYRLHAYAGGKRFALDAENRGDWYDVEAVVGLVNALLVARRSDSRLVVLPTGDQTAKVIAGPAKGIAALVTARLIDVGEASDAERVGKEFEDRVFDQLREDGQDVLRDVPMK